MIVRTAETCYVNYCLGFVTSTTRIKLTTVVLDSIFCHTALNLLRYDTIR